MVEDKQNYYHLSVSVKAHLTYHQTHALYVNGTVGEDSRELCQLGPLSW